LSRRTRAANLIELRSITLGDQHGIQKRRLCATALQSGFATAVPLAADEIFAPREETRGE
jgi:hypothetical protein